MDFVKIISLCLIGTVLSVILKALAPSFSVLLSVFISLLISGICIYWIVPYIEFINEMAEWTSFSEYMKVLFKVCGIAMLTRFASEICKDAGETVYASKALMVGKTTILLCVLPIIKTLFEQVKEFIS